MGHNRAGVRRSKRLRRGIKEQRRLLEKSEGKKEAPKAAKPAAKA